MTRLRPGSGSPGTTGTGVACTLAKVALGICELAARTALVDRARKFRWGGQPAGVTISAGSGSSLHYAWPGRAAGPVQRWSRSERRVCALPAWSCTDALPLPVSYTHLRAHETDS